MKLYSSAKAPNPRRVVMAIAEKGITGIEVIDLDLGRGDNLTAEFRARNPIAKVPVLELDDGTCIAESAAIIRYLDELYPQHSLYGSEPLQRALVDMWDHRIEHAFFIPVGHCFQHTTGFFKDRMTPVAEWGTEAGKLAANFLPVLEAQLSKHTYVAGEQFSMADITALCTLEFARIIKLRAGDEFPAIQRWHALMQQRPSYTA